MKAKFYQRCPYAALTGRPPTVAHKGRLHFRLVACRWLIITIYLCSLRSFALTSTEHHDITQEIATSLGFSPEAIKLVAQAATEPDAYDWATAPAHAQTPNDQTGKPSQRVEQAEEASRTYLRSQALHMRQELDNNDIGNSAYILGYALHTIQDYAAHLGMTNADHSFLSFEGHNPDKQLAHIERARLWTREFFASTANSLGACEWQKLQMFTARAEQRDHWREFPELNSKRETDFADYAKYEELISRFKKLREPERSVRWLPIETVHTSLISAFADSAKNQSGDKALLFTGEWLATSSNSQNSLLSITRTPQHGILVLNADHASISWRLIVSQIAAQGLPIGKKRQGDVPDSIWARAEPKLERYLNLALLEDKTCKIKILYEEDSVEWQMQHSTDGTPDRPTGEFKILSKPPNLIKTAVALRKKD